MLLWCDAFLVPFVFNVATSIASYSSVFANGRSEGFVVAPEAKCDEILENGTAHFRAGAGFTVSLRSTSLEWLVAVNSTVITCWRHWSRH